MANQTSTADVQTAHAAIKSSVTAKEGPVCWVYASPWGDLVVRGEADVIRSVRFQPGQCSQNIEQASWLEACRQQLDGYFAGKAVAFDLPLAPLGTDFQHKVWAQLQQIPYGQLCSYQQLAEQLGNTGAVRAVASANARNPISLFVPCHRVIGQDRALRGYAGGLEVKARLLGLEGHNLSAGEVTARSKIYSD